ncbi:hypothetical protein Droror1_Dr00014150 [Drosera rotundifolia]
MFIGVKKEEDVEKVSKREDDPGVENNDNGGEKNDEGKKKEKDEGNKIEKMGEAGENAGGAGGARNNAGGETDDAYANMKKNRRISWNWRMQAFPWCRTRCDEAGWPLLARLGSRCGGCFEGGELEEMM